jgi:hypothetical protein
VGYGPQEWADLEGQKLKKPTAETVDMLPAFRVQLATRNSGSIEVYTSLKHSRYDVPTDSPVLLSVKLLVAKKAPDDCISIKYLLQLDPLQKMPEENPTLPEGKTSS